MALLVLSDVQATRRGEHTKKPPSPLWQSAQWGAGLGTARMDEQQGLPGA